MTLNENFLKTMMESSATRALELAGVSSNEVSFTKGKRLYGAWFVKEVESGRLQPSRCGGEIYTKKYYKVSDILAHKASQEGAEIIF